MAFHPASAMVRQRCPGLCRTVERTQAGVAVAVSGRTTIVIRCDDHEILGNAESFARVGDEACIAVNFKALVGAGSRDFPFGQPRSGKEG